MADQQLQLLPGRVQTGLQESEAVEGSSLQSHQIGVIGFITGILGLLVLVPATRNWLAEMTLRHFTQRPRTPPPGTIDLTPDEWRQLPDPELPSRRSRRKPEDRNPG